jgi:hypothetical protein
MPAWKNAMEIFSLLDKSNCRKCNEMTCLAFDAAVFKGRKTLSECPHLDEKILARFEAHRTKPPDVERDMEAALTELKGQVARLDFKAAARRLGAKDHRNRLTLKIFGKDFSVDSDGNLSSDIHIHPWVAMPFLSYILKSTPAPLAGRWVPFRELNNGKAWHGLYRQRCEIPLKRVADHYPDLFEDLITLFDGKQVQSEYTADITIVLSPLPKIPILLCYWNAEDNFPSDLNLFFDAASETHLEIESIWALLAGLVRMFEKIALRHGVDASALGADRDPMSGTGHR